MKRHARLTVATACALATALTVSRAAQLERATGTATAIIAAGGFWCVEEPFDTRSEVIATTSDN